MTHSKALQRQEFIMDILEKNEDVSTKELAEILNVSVWTIRRDLNALEERKVLARFYGGAKQDASKKEICKLIERGSFRESASENQGAKKRISLAAARLIHPGERVALTGGTTTYEVAKALKKLRFKGEIVTNALDIALVLSEEPDIHVVCTGGDVQPRYHTLVGPISERILKMHYFDVAVIGVSGISLRHGFTVYSQVNATALELVAEHSCRMIMLADATKLGQVSFASLNISTHIDTFVTDEPLPPEYGDYFQNLGVDVVIAERSQPF